MAHRAFWLAVLLVTTATGTLASQARARAVPVPGLVVSVRRDLTFGDVLRGVPTAVAPTDIRAARFEIIAPHAATIEVSMLLPTALRTHSGDELPVRFGPGDALVTHATAAHHTEFTFDPAGPVVTVIEAHRPLGVRLGGTVVPGRLQSVGAYRATLTLIVADLGT